jgi:predicted Zn-dependent protease
VMRRLSQHYGEKDFGAISYLSTHPPSVERVEAAERAAGLAPGDPAATPSPVAPAANMPPKD